MMGGYLPPDYTPEYKAPVVPPKSYPDTLIGSTDVRPLLNLLSELDHGAAIAVDTETTGLFPYQDDVIRGVSIAFRRPTAKFPAGGGMVIDDVHGGEIASFYIPVNYPEAYDNLSAKSQQMVFGAIKNLDPFLVLHHGKFDFAFLRQLPMAEDGGVFFPTPRADDSWWDTKVVAWLLDENLPTGLKEQASFHFGEDQKDEQKAVKKLLKERGGWDKLTPADTAAYAAKDAELTLRLYELQRELVDGDHPSVLGNPAPAIARELAIQGVLGRMERLGILVNPTLLQEMTESTAKRCAEIETEFLTLDYTHPYAGGIDQDLYSIPEKGLNINSPKQLAAFLTATQGVKVTTTARDALERLPSSPVVDKIMEHRRLKKALTGYLRPLAERMGRDGRIHAHFNSTGTVTGRFSSSAPNLQTIPRSDTLVGVRDLFIAEPGFELWEYDLSAAEMRVMGGMAGQQNMIEALESGADVHGMLAAQVFGEKYTPLQRRYAKNIGYGWNYGLSNVNTAAKYIQGADGKKIAKKILDGLRKLYPEVVALMNRTTRRAEVDGYVPIHETAWPGRYRRFRTPSLRRSPAYTSLNAQIQGGIGELMKDVMLYVEEPLAFWGARICLQVHDSLVIEIQPGTDPYVQGVLQGALDKLNPFAMPMIFDAHEWSEHE